MACNGVGARSGSAGRIALLGCIVASVVAGGCSSMRMEMAMEPIEMRMEGPMMVFEGYYISDSLLARVEPGTTSDAWVRALLGEPTEVRPLPDGSEVWVYLYREHGISTSILGASDEEPSLPQQLTFVHIRQGAVIETWRG